MELLISGRKMGENGGGATGLSNLPPHKHVCGSLRLSSG